MPPTAGELTGAGDRSGIEPADIRASHLYRPDIDGIRAVAVAAVVLFHAGVPGLGGGFVGVDIFFVLSGYLISGIILRGLEREKFSLADFYVRRINRIVPALLVVIVATFALGWLFLFAREFPNLGKHTIGGSTFSSNFFFYRELGYFDLPDKPLLHLWSLAVEEQFYLLWPATLLVLWKTGRDVRWSLIAIVEISFLVNVWEVRHSGGMSAFYLPFSRFWEILAGSLLVQVESSRDSAALKWNELAERWRNALAAAGVLLIVLSFVVARSGDLWPGLKGLLPVVGTAFLVAAGSRAWINGKILSWRPLVALGLVSYPLYLWHWPLLVFGRIVNEGDPPTWAKIALVFLALALAISTYRFIEKPIRFGSHKRRSAIRLIPGLAATGLLGAAAYFGVIGTRLDGSEKKTIARWGPDWQNPGTEIFDTLGFHFFGTRAADSATVVFYGDSHAQQYWPRVLALGLDSVPASPRVMLLARGNCPPLPKTDHTGRDWAGNEWRCDVFNGAAVVYIMKPRVKTVVIAAYWERYLFDDATFLTSAPASHFRIGDAHAVKAFDLLGDNIAAFVKAGKKVYLILSNPTPETHLPSGLPRRLAGFGSMTTLPPTSRAHFVEANQWMTAQLRRIAVRSGAKLIDPVDVICDNTSCPLLTADGEPVFKDDNHFRAGFVARHATFIDRTLAVH